MKNGALNKAKTEKNDEFYTLYEDIEKELAHYTEQLKDKIIYCNCDDYTKSNFVKYFRDNFDVLQIKKLIATHYIQQNIFDDIKVYKFEKTKDNENVSELNGDGDFKSIECINILKTADIIITNPPFSLFRVFILLLLKYNKNFILVGPQNAVVYKKLFPYIKNDIVHFGYTKIKSFIKPNDTKQNFGNIRWFTNLVINNVHKPLKLNTMEYNIQNNKYVKKEGYKKYDNYDALNIPNLSAIPSDYDKVMGVPITILDYYNKEQFDIVGISSYFSKGAPYINGHRMYSRILITHKQ